MVANALSRKSTGSISHLKVVYLLRLVELRSLGVRLELTDIGALLATFHVRLVLINRIRELQTQDPTVIKLKREAESGQLHGFSVRADGDGSQVLCTGCGRIKERNYRRGSLFCICDASGKHKNVSYPERTLLVEVYEERCCRVCLKMSYLSAS